jgi:hypothetical protein
LMLFVSVLHAPHLSMWNRFSVSVSAWEAG